MASALKRGCRFIVILFVLLLAVAVGAGLWLWQGHRGFADAPIGGTAAGATVEVASGDAFPTVLRKLRESGVSHGTDLQWRLLARQRREKFRIAPADVGGPGAVVGEQTLDVGHGG